MSRLAQQDRIDGPAKLQATELHLFISQVAFDVGDRVKNEIRIVETNDRIG